MSSSREVRGSAPPRRCEVSDRVLRVLLAVAVVIQGFALLLYGVRQL